MISHTSLHKVKLFVHYCKVLFVFGYETTSVQYQIKSIDSILSSGNIFGTKQRKLNWYIPGSISALSMPCSYFKFGSVIYFIWNTETAIYTCKNDVQGDGGEYKCICCYVSFRHSFDWGVSSWTTKSNSIAMTVILSLTNGDSVLFDSHHLNVCVCLSLCVCVCVSVSVSLSVYCTFWLCHTTTIEWSRNYCKIDYVHRFCENFPSLYEFSICENWKLQT